MAEPLPHQEWCEPSQCMRYPAGTHVSLPLCLDDDSVLMFLMLAPDELPHLVIQGADETHVRVPLHYLRGFLLAVAQLAGSVDWPPQEQRKYLERLAAAYHGGPGHGF